MELEKFHYICIRNKSTPIKNMRTALSFLIPALLGCNPMEDIPGFGDDKKKIDFDIMVTRAGNENHEDF